MKVQMTKLNRTYTPPGHLTEEQLLRYQTEQMPHAELHRVEQHLLDCALCSDALEGLVLLPPQQQQAAVAEIKARIARQTSSADRDAAPPYWRWAAAAAVFLVALSALFFLIQPFDTAKQPLVQQEPAPSEAAPEAYPAEDSDLTEQLPPPVQVQEERALAEEAEAVESPQAVAEAPAAKADPPETEEQKTKVQNMFSPARPLPSAPQSIEIAADEEAVSELEVAPVSPAPQAARRAKPTTSVEMELAGRAAGVAVTNKFAADQRVLQGKVVDDMSGEPLPGVAVRIKGSSTGTITDIEGNYILPLPPTETVLQISFIGFSEKEVRIDPSTTQSVVRLQEDLEALSEVVVTGYSRRSEQATAAPDSYAQPVEGMRAFRKWVKENMVYPPAAAEAGVEGVVVVEFFVETDSTLSNFQVKRSLGHGLDEEALRLLREGPKWQAATAAGSPIRQQVRVRIPFKLPRR